MIERDRHPQRDAERRHPERSEGSRSNTTSSWDNDSSSCYYNSELSELGPSLCSGSSSIFFEQALEQMHWVTLPGLLNYQDGLKIMEDLLLEVIGGTKPDTIFLSEYNSVYTAGTSYNQNELLNPTRFPVVYTGRGGKFTYHGPGQRVIYPIINLNNKKDLKLYIKTLEHWIIKALAQFKIDAFIIPNKVGIWVLKNGKPAKIGAIGVRVKKWVAYHGIAVNINPNLEHYNGIIPCGINDFPVTSLKDIGVDISMEEFDMVLKRKW